MLHTGASRPLVANDLPPLARDDTARVAADAFGREWSALAAVGDASGPRAVARAHWRTYGAEFTLAGLVKLAADVCQLSAPLLLKRLVRALEAGAGLRQGIWLSAWLLLLGATQAVALRHYFALVFRTGMRVRASVVTSTYRKLLSLSPSAQNTVSSGEITNLMGSDATRIGDLTPYLHALWFAPLQAIVALTILYREVGPAALPGLLLVCSTLFINKRIAAATFRVQQRLLGTRDSRAKSMRELLGGIQVIKLYAWELDFAKRTRKLRLDEGALMRSLAWLRSVLAALFTCTPTLAAAAILGVRTITTKESLTLSTAMTVISTVNILRSPLVFLPLVLQSLQEANLSLGRMARFLNAEECKPLSSGSLKSVGIAIDGADFQWEALDAAGTPSPPPLYSPEPAAVEEGSATAASTLDDHRGFALRDVSLTAGPGQFVALVGAVGSGKSTLLQGLLGDVPRTAGSVSLCGRVAYAAQTPFIVPGTLRDNILFGAPYDEARYMQVLDACALRPDVDSFAAGDLTPIGDKGVSLSGGQRARVALARAVYSDADIYLLDDPLAACDPIVAASLMQRVIGPTGLLAGKLRILVTSQILLTREADEVVVLHEGRVAEMGSYEQLEGMGEHFARIASAHNGNGEARREQGGPAGLAVDSRIDGGGRVATEAAAHAQLAHKGNESVASTRESVELAAAEAGTPPEHLTGATEGDKVTADTMEGESDEVAEVALSSSTAAAATAVGGGLGDDGHVTGRVRAEMLMEWIRAAGGKRALLLAVTPLIGAELVSLGSNWWLTRWASAPSSAQLAYLSVYAAFAVASAGMIVLRSRLMLGVGIRAGLVLHDELLSRVVRAPLAFFDVTPRGRLLSRFTRETQTVDVSLPSALQTYGSTLMSVVATIAVVTTSSPLVGLFLLPITLVYVALQRFYSASSRELKRIESVSRAPLLSHLAASLDGLPSIRAYDAAQRFEREAEAALDANLRASIVSSLVNCWLGLRLEVIGSTIAAAAAALAFARNSAVAGTLGLGSGALGAAITRALTLGVGGVGTAALAVTLAMQVTQTLNWTVRQATEVEAHLIAVERLRSFNSLEPEPGYEVEDAANEMAASSAAAAAARSSQPEALELSGLSMRYRENLPLVLDGVSVRVAPGEKIGVVGRTGSGKSSLIKALTRVVAPPLRTGAIELDGRDIASIPLHAHRSHVAVIPQEPMFFSGSVRDNLDPLQRHTDDELWGALKSVAMAHAVRSLDDEVAEEGTNFSAGQRQLLSIARALLTDATLVLLDEATSAVDGETDAIIQRTVRYAFRGATVFTIAHRLNTVLDSDKIMVLDQGKLVEFGTPRELMGRAHGHFRGMVHAHERL